MKLSGRPARDAALDAAAGGFRTFAVVWLGQLVSLIGSGITRFALGVWVYERTGSATQFTLIAVSVALPGLLIAPLAGAMVDRWNRRWVMLASDLAAGLSTLALAALYWSDALQLWHIYLIVGIGSIFGSFQMPAYLAASTLLVPKQHLNRSSGMIQLGQASAGVVSAPVAGALFTPLGLGGIIVIDVATFLFAVTTLCFVRVPSPPKSADGTQSRGSLLQEAAYGWRFIRQRPGLLGLLLYFALMNLAFSIAAVLVIPLVRSFSTVALLGIVLAIQSAGQVVGSLSLTLTGGPRQRVRAILLCGLLIAVSMLIVGLRPFAPLVAAGLFLMMFCFAFMNGCSQAVWQTKVPPDVQGRVFAVRRLIAQITSPIGFFLAGPLADYV
ncbi:MAG: MFS transporter, partial [Acidobacteriota bacterium]